jgi:hypothetical protein
VLDLRKEIEGKKFVDGVQAIKARLQKHFESHDLDLVPPLWQRVATHMVTTIHRVDIASKYFQIKTHSKAAAADDDKDVIKVALHYLQSIEM